MKQIAVGVLFLIFFLGCTQPTEPQPAPATPEPPVEPEPVTVKGITQSQCEAGGGRWNDCGSACRTDPPGTPCIEVCVAYCECGTWNELSCPEDYHCTDLVPPYAALAMGVCKPLSEIFEPAEEAAPEWILEGVRIAGNYADSDIVQLPDGRYRMYYAIEPEVSGNRLEVFSATSSDGLSWQQDSGTRMEWATFPDVIQLPDGRYRMYYQNDAVIKSAISSDGLRFTEEEGIRVNVEEPGFELDNVGSPTTILLDDWTYQMVYRGTINEKYGEELVPNDNMGLFLYATSEDGLHFQKKGLVLDSRNSELKGWADGPDFVQWEDGIRLYFWSYRGVYYITYDGTFSADPVFDFSTASNPQNLFPANPPGDPTIIKMQDGYRMYFGQHTEGIYSAFLELGNGEMDSREEPDPAAEFLHWEKQETAIYGGISASSIIRNGKLMTYYVGQEGIALAESNDGISFTEQGAVLGPDPGEQPGLFLSNPGLMELEDGTLRMIYEGSTPPAQEDRQLYSAVSSNGVSWQKEQGIRHSDIDPHGMQFTSVPDLIQVNGEWLLFYTSGDVSRIARSNDEGITWEKWKEIGIEKYHVILDPDINRLEDGRYLLLFTTFPSNRFGQGKQIISAAVADEDMNFEWMGDVKVEGETSRMILDPEIVRLPDGQYYLYYSTFISEGVSNIERASLRGG